MISSTTGACALSSAKYSDHIALPAEIENGRERRRKTVIRGKINKAQAPVTPQQTEVNDDEYKEFYKHIASRLQHPLTELTAWKVSRSITQPVVYPVAGAGYVDP